LNIYKNYNKYIFVSAINIINGGPKTILEEYINILAQENPNFIIIVCINSNFSIKLNYDNISFISFTYPEKNILFRLYFEYIHLFFISLKLKPTYVISFNDITPNMISKFKLNYVHSPMSFEKIKLKFLIISPIFFFKILFFRLTHILTLNLNNIIIVQQQQIKNKLIKRYSILENKIFVCNPSINFDSITISSDNDYKKGDFILFYPSIPRILKNIHLVCEAIDKINKFSKHNIILQITLNGTENKYAKKLKNLYSKNKNIHFLGLLDRSNVLNYLTKCHALIFASEYETWGLPISEAKFFNKHIFVLDEEYAHETISDYKKVNFFSKNNICQVLLNRLNNNIEYSLNNVPKFSNNKFIDIFNSL